MVKLRRYFETRTGRGLTLFGEDAGAEDGNSFGGHGGRRVSGRWRSSRFVRRIRRVL